MTDRTLEGDVTETKEKVPWFVRMLYPDIVLPMITMAFMVFMGWASCHGR